MRCKSHFEVLGGPLYQWDTGRQLRIAPQDGGTVIEVHFARPTNEKAVVVLPTETAPGEYIANIPDALLQTAAPVNAYAVAQTETGERTTLEAVLAVRPRAQPEDYVYTEAETLSYTALDARVKALEDGGGGGAIDDTAPSATTTYSSQKLEAEFSMLTTGIRRVESLATDTLVQLRDLPTGLYVLYGYFSPFTDSHISMIFDNTMVVVAHKTAGSHLLVFTGTYSKVNFLQIMADSAAPAGYTYTRTDYVLDDMHNLIEEVGELASLATTGKSSIVAAINELSARIDGLAQKA